MALLEPMYVPISHAVHELLPGDETYDPPTHLSQLCDPFLELMKPGAHMMHSVAVSRENFPTGQIWHDDEASSEKNPVVQPIQLVALVVLL